MSVDRPDKYDLRASGYQSRCHLSICSAKRPGSVLYTVRSIEGHAVVRIGIRGRIVTIEVHRARIVTVVGIAKTISTTKTGVKDFHLYFFGCKGTTKI